MSSRGAKAPHPPLNAPLVEPDHYNCRIIQKAVTQIPFPNVLCIEATAFANFCDNNIPPSYPLNQGAHENY